MNNKPNKQAVFVTYHRVNRDIDFGRYRYDRDDLILIKERTERKEGGYLKKLRMVENYERPFWITKPAARKHKDKREWEYLENLKLFRCPHHELSYRVQKALGVHNIDPKLPMRIINRNPYIYGTDQSPSYYVKEAYGNNYNHWRAGPNEVAFLDIETDVLGPNSNKIILISTVAGGNWGCVYALKEFISKTTLDYRNQFFEILDNDLPTIRKEHGYNVELRVFDNEIDMLKNVFAELHKRMPDYVGGWNNLMFDQDVIAKRLVELGEDPAMYFSAPEVPDKYKGYRFVEGKKYAISDSGKKTNLRPIQRWHEVVAPASFRWIDNMCLFYQLRKIYGMWPSYRLDYVLNRVIGIGKYEIPEAESKRGLDKHIFMQRYYPVHYAVYNLFDTVGLDLMDKKVGDVRNKFDILLGDSDFRTHQSNPGKLMDSFQSFLRRQRGAVLGSTSDQMFTEVDARLPPLDGWIVALPTTMLDESSGMCVLEEAPHIRSKIRNHCGDDDIESSYPICGIFDNISRLTTEIEVIDIHGKTLDDRRRFGLNLMACKSNAIDNCRLIFDMPSLVELEDIYDEHYVEFLSSR